MYNFRACYYSSIFMLILTGNTISIIRLLIVIQVFKVLSTHLIKICVQWGQVTEADPELLTKYIIMFQGILVSLITVSDITEGFKRGRLQLNHWKHLLENVKYSGDINNNFVAYLTGGQKNEDEDFVRTTLYYLMLGTFINMLLTYTFIHFYLRCKHSAAIKIAERTNTNTKENFISFKKLIVLFILVGFLTYCNFKVHNSDLVDDVEVIPPVLVVVCVIISINHLPVQQEISCVLSAAKINKSEHSKFVKIKKSETRENPETCLDLKFSIGLNVMYPWLCKMLNRFLQWRI